MKKIAILTYIKEYANHGTNMQSYSTLKAIQKAFPDDHVELIDYSGWKPAMRPYLSNVSLKSLVNDFIRIKKYKKFFKEELVFSKTKLISANLSESLRFIKKQNYDAIYIGADTLLELKRAAKNELTAYWLDNTVKSKKFLIAASSHNVVFETLSGDQKKKIQETVDDFSLLGVRDEPTLRLISKFIEPSDARLQLIPDPTFTYNIEYNSIDAYLKKRNLKFSKPVVCLHLTRKTSWANELAERFKKAGFQVASFRPAYFADILFTDLSAHEQAGIYKYFDLVITHRFHDSIFAIKNLTPVIFFPEHTTDVTPHKESKTLTMFKSFNLDKTNYIEDKASLTAGNLFNMYPEAIKAFHENKEHIRTVLTKNKETYEAYIEKSKSMI